MSYTKQGNVKVKNTGDTAGKDVVQVYFTPPYTNGGIEKASVNLIDSGKRRIHHFPSFRFPHSSCRREL